MPTPFKLLNFLFFVLSLLACYFSLITFASAQQEFTTIYDTTYQVNTEGQAEVEQKISLTNNFSKIYASSYSLKIEGKKPENIVVAAGKETLPAEFKESEGRYEIIINFPEALVGKGKSREFTVRYTIGQIAARNGKVWEVSIPKLAAGELVNEYSLTLKVPYGYGVPAYISPQPRSKNSENGLQIFTFNKDDLTKAGVVATFGDFQVFSFNLNYHLQNLTNKEIEREIALIPDTSYQKVYYESLFPQPLSTRVDEDGNWLATYKLKPKESINVAALVFVDVFAQPQENFKKTDAKNFNFYLTGTDTWQVNDPQIQTLAKTLKKPQAIYDFVVSKLNYDYGRVQEGVERFGAVKALKNPDNAICMEFTDLFIALSRAAGIPAREVNGYAYTENPELQPLSLVADVLHAWPEYWDEKRQVWQPVDPTWEDTTGGIDFFQKFDLSHVTFAIHGKDSRQPLPAGSYKEEGKPQKDITAQFGVLNQKRSEITDITITHKNTPLLPFAFDLPFIANKYSVKVKNNGPIAIYSKPLYVSGGNLISQQKIDTLIPFSTYEAEVMARSPFFPFLEQSKLVVNFGDVQAEYSLSSENILLSRIVLFLMFILLILGAAFSPRVWTRLKRLLERA